MPVKQPDNSNPQFSNTDEELRQALLKLREQGKIKDLPDYLTANQPGTPAGAGAQVAESADVAPDQNTNAEAMPAVAETATPDDDRGSIQAPTAQDRAVQPAGVDSGHQASVEVPERVSAVPAAERETKIVISRRGVDDTASKADKPVATPWTLQQFFDGEIDLEVELSKRFSMMPMMSTVKFRTLGSQAGRRVATLEAADGSATLIIDADVPSKVIQLSFTYGSMLTLRFSLDTLTGADQSRWLELMKREQGGLAFLWGPGRWQSDYMICISRRYVTSIYAFSPNNFEAAIRLTPAVMADVLKWLHEIWNAPDDKPDQDTPLLTW
jgi:hypothetical protein